jgi:hypothetical protein
MAACFLITGVIESATELAACFHSAGFSVDRLYPLPDLSGSARRPRHLLLSSSQDTYIERSSFSLSRARALRKLAARLRGNAVQVELLNRPSLSMIPAALADDILLPSLGEPTSSDEVVLAQLSARNFPSSVCLVRSPDGSVRVRKTFCPGFRKNVDSELRARELISDTRVSPVLAASETSIYLPWYREYRTFSPGLFSFYPIEAARSVMSFLEELNVRGLAMVDINPGCFLYDAGGNIRVVDFEFLSEAVPQSDFMQSTDFSGLAGGAGGPARRGWNHFGRDATGVPYSALQSGRPGTVAAWRVAQVGVRLAVRHFEMLRRLRKLIAVSYFYWSRRAEWSVQVTGASSKIRLSSLRTMTSPKHYG